MQRKDFQPLRECPFCGGEATIQQDTRYPRYGKKDTVKAYEPICTNTDCLIYKADNVYFTSEKKAIAAWNRRAQPENEALTLDELRQMDGEPIYIKHLFGKWHWDGWHILENCEEELIMHDGSILLDENYGKTWLAYRRKPERSEGE